MANLSNLVRLCIDVKEGNKEFALFYADYEDENFKPWRAEIGNPVAAVSLGESTGEFCGEGMTPELAVEDLVNKLIEHRRAA